MTVSDWEKESAVVVLGASGVIGTAIAAAVAKSGRTVVATGCSSPQKVESLCQGFSGPGRMIPMTVNLYQEDSIREFAQKLHELGMPVSGVVKCVGGNRRDATVEMGVPFEQLPVDAMSRLISENWSGLANAVKYLCPVLLESGGPSSFVSIGSETGTYPLTKVGGYSCDMAAEHQFVRWLALQYGKLGRKIRFNVVAPGFILTEQNRFLLTNEDGTLTPRGESILSATPMNHFGKPEDIGGVVRFLLSEESGFVTGQVLFVDGGFSISHGV